MTREQLEHVGKAVLDSIFEVHRELGLGLLESAYEMALSHELTLRRLRFERQKAIPVRYQGVNLECGFRIDTLVEEEVVLELKSVDSLLPIHDAQLINYLRLSDKRLGFLVNSNIPRIKDGIKRRVNKLDGDNRRPRDFAL